MLIPSIIKGNDMPKHLAITCNRIRSWAQHNKKEISEAVNISLKKIDELIDLQIKKDIPILTIMLSTQTEEEVSGINELFGKLSNSDKINENKIRIYVTGNWYDAEATIVDSAKKVMDSTKDYDKYFLNFCVKYDGQKEILTGTKLLLKKAQHNMLNIDDLSLEGIKENIPSNNFIPPELLIENDSKYSGLLLWDIKGSFIHFTHKYWLDFEKQDFDKAVDILNKTK